MSNHAIKLDWIKATGVDKSKFAKEVDLADLKSDIDDLEKDKMKNFPFDLYMLSNAVEKEVVKKDVYDELVKNVNAFQAIDATYVVKKALES